MKLRMLPILLFLLLLSCGDSQPDTYTVEIIDGVRHVHNHAPLWGDEKRIALEFVRKIGELEGDDENVRFFRPTDIVRDDEGNYYILDKGNFRVQKFSPEFEYIRTIGKRGEGPGEFGSPWSVLIAGNFLLVPDVRLQRVQKFTRDGEPAGSFRIPVTSMSLSLCKSGNIVAAGMYKPGESKGQLEISSEKVKGAPLAAVFDPGGNILYTIGVERWYDEPLIRLRGNLFLYTFDTGGNHIVTYHYQNRIEKFTPEGDFLFRADTARPFEETTAMESMRSAVTSFAGSIQADGSDRIWVQVNTRQIQAGDWDRLHELTDLYHLEVYSPEGVMLGIIQSPLGASFSLIAIEGDRMFFSDTEREMAVYEYRIVDME